MVNFTSSLVGFKEKLLALSFMGFFFCDEIEGCRLPFVSSKSVMDRAGRDEKEGVPGGWT